MLIRGWYLFWYVFSKYKPIRQAILYLNVVLGWRSTSFLNQLLSDFDLNLASTVCWSVCSFKNTWLPKTPSKGQSFHLILMVSSLPARTSVTENRVWKRQKHYDIPWKSAKPSALMQFSVWDVSWSLWVWRWEVSCGSCCKAWPPGPNLSIWTSNWLPLWLFNHLCMDR